MKLLFWVKMEWKGNKNDFTDMWIEILYVDTERKNLQNSTDWFLVQSLFSPVWGFEVPFIELVFEYLTFLTTYTGFRQTLGHYRFSEFSLLRSWEPALGTVNYVWKCVFLLLYVIVDKAWAEILFLLNRIIIFRTIMCLTDYRSSLTLYWRVKSAWDYYSKAGSEDDVSPKEPPEHNWGLCPTVKNTH